MVLPHKVVNLPIINLNLNIMESIKIEIVIPEHEYKNWSDYQEGIEQVMQNLKTDMRNRLRQEYVQHFTIEVTNEH